MKITHRVPIREPVSAVLTPDYEAEVQRATNRAERRYAAGLAQLEAAEHRLARARTLKDKKLATAIVELRREQLELLERLMQSAPASATHRGVRSYRKTPPGRGSLL